ncbi:hypothetical protein SAMN05660216_04243 [Pseudomonas sp. LAMO17WK12:I8]|uniref:Uncharacterized protein n=1 Tax=Pseudomonas monteilii TaxID=76759 RepID=A0AAE6RAL2_9PSED|nr:hypothetical protein [Pseudomonas sp. OG7]PXX61140.1 hypothetical protein D906_04338 [Pseudomonas sp. LAIL14HWK12:I1]QHB27302.1 hypothetical protein TCK1_1956 [Pseudomonas monteilii]SMD15996.1 hypothetical protein SAMN05660385_04973 [Pseudomonas sp. URIL14HWK12:I5]SNB85732.1 hypothetical protein SAMN02745900_04764 [Pseudomonas sp. URIL14HWK12:I8]SNT42470.1 hypothetical protein SAMN05660216_04243 [Pseudomonas sp. LAMO17WK12:I8]SNY35796.1 hypothetical protein SAMN05660893_04103 [Pseudomonas 
MLVCLKKFGAWEIERRPRGRRSISQTTNL